jgi:hypothetical protein
VEARTSPAGLAKGLLSGSCPRLTRQCECPLPTHRRRPEGLLSLDERAGQRQFGERVEIFPTRSTPAAFPTLIDAPGSEPPPHSCRPVASEGRLACDPGARRERLERDLSSRGSTVSPTVASAQGSSGLKQRAAARRAEGPQGMKPLGDHHEMIPGKGRGGYSDRSRTARRGSLPAGGDRGKA